MNILITSAGRRVSLVSYFSKELKKSFKKSSKIFTTDLEPSYSPACLKSDKSFKVGKFSNLDYIDQLLQICIKNNISLLIPTIDTELQLYSLHRKLFKENGIEIIISDSGFVDICRDKRKTNSFFEQRGIRIPAIQDRNNPKFPVFIKPVDGSSSQDIYFIDNPSKLSDFLKENERLMWMEYLPKEKFREYTIDLYYNKESELCCAVPRFRLAVRSGEVNKGITHKDAFIISFIREKLGRIDGARGCITLQLFYALENKEVYGIEINPRFGGGYPLSYLSGANYPHWIIQEYLFDKDIRWFDGWEDNLLLLRYDSEMIIHAS